MSINKLKEIYFFNHALRFSIESSFYLGSVTFTCWLSVFTTIPVKSIIAQCISEVWLTVRAQIWRTLSETPSPIVKPHYVLMECINVWSMTRSLHKPLQWRSENMTVWKPVTNLHITKGALQHDFTFVECTFLQIWHN